MAIRLTMLFVLVFTSSFSSLLAETRKELRTKGMNQDTVIQLGSPTQYNRVDPSQVIQLSWRPRVFLYSGFLSDEECEHLIILGHDKKGKFPGSVDDFVKADNLHTDSGLSLDTKDETLARIEERISAWIFVPKEYGKPLQVQHVGTEEAKQLYHYFGNKSRLSEPVMATVILYLSNVSQGGQILFPESQLGNSQMKNKILSDCTKSSYALRPTRGNALLFFNLHPNTTPDQSSSHARCPVLDGEMWFATKFFHLKASDVQTVQFQADGSDCTDEEESCPQWAAIGECQRNPIFMIGSPDYYGTCRKSCNAC